MADFNEHKYTIIRSSRDECIKELYKKYGTNYDPLDIENVVVPGGLFNLFKRGAVKITYTLRHNPSPVRDPLEKQRLTEDQMYEQSREKILKDNSDKLITAQLNQINNINDSMHQMMEEMNNKLQNLTVGKEENHESIKRIEELLEQNEFSISFIRMIEDKIRNAFSLDELDDFDLVQRRVVDWIGESIEIVKDVVIRPPHVFIIVGPTGVGKTTTLVKLAFQFVKKFANDHEGQKPEIRFITTDTMRVGAMEQLARWGERMHTSVLKAERTDDLISIINENKSEVDAIFIDTSGYSPNDAEHLAQIKVLLDIPGLNPDVYLACTASTKARDLHNIMKNYEPFGYNSVIITKCDESEQLGNVISVLYERHKKVSYVTSGQIASRDISKADIVHFLMNLDGFNIDRVHIEDVFGE